MSTGELIEIAKWTRDRLQSAIEQLMVERIAGAKPLTVCNFEIAECEQKVRWIEDVLARQEPPHE